MWSHPAPMMWSQSPKAKSENEHMVGETTCGWSGSPARGRLFGPPGPNLPERLSSPHGVEKPPIVLMGEVIVVCYMAPGRATRIAKSAADFNVQWIEMVRANTNSALDFSRQLVGVKSPAEFLELSAVHARKQFEIFTEQAKQLRSLAQKVTTDAVQPLQAGVKSTFSKAA
jgi:hypothetical protein